MNTEKVDVKNVLLLTGTFCSAWVGAGTATGQEVIQYMTAFGIKGTIGVCITSFIVGLVVQIVLMYIGYSKKDDRGIIVYEELMGKYVGKLFSWIVPICIFVTSVVMLSGTGSTIEEYFGLNKSIGCAIAVIIIVGCAALGFSKIFKGVGMLGIFLMIVIFLIAVIFIIKNGFGSWQEKESFIMVTDMLKAASTWWLSAINYSLFALVLAVQLLSAMGSKANNKKEVMLGAFFGNVLFCVTILLMSIAMELDIENTFDKEIPFLKVADDLSAGVGFGYTILILLAVFTTLTPIIWETLVRIGAEGTSKYYITAVVIAILGYFGGKLPFAVLANIVYPAIGYIGVILLVASIVYIIRKLKENKNTQI